MPLHSDFTYCYFMPGGKWYFLCLLSTRAMADHQFVGHLHLPRVLLDTVDDEWRKDRLEDHAFDSFTSLDDEGDEIST